MMYRANIVQITIDCEGHKEIGITLMERGASVNVKDKFGNTPLMLAASKGQKDLINELIQRGADLNVSCFCDGKAIYTSGILNKTII